jgi:hypothetical protein
MPTDDPSSPIPRADQPQIIDLGEALKRSCERPLALNHVLGGGLGCAHMEGEYRCGRLEHTADRCGAHLDDLKAKRPFDVEACRAALDAAAEVSTALVDSLGMMGQGFSESERTRASDRTEKWVALAPDARRHPQRAEGARPMTAAPASSTPAEHVETVRCRIVTDTSRAVLMFVANAGELLPTSALGQAAWIQSWQIVSIAHDGHFGHTPGHPAVLQVRGDIGWKRARLIGDQVHWLDGAPVRSLEKRPPNPVAPWPRGSRPSSPAPLAVPGEVAFREAIAKATIERTSAGGASIDELLARFRHGVTLRRSEDATGPGWFAAAIVERDGDAGSPIHTTAEVGGADPLDALERLDAARVAHEQSRTASRARARGGR